MAGRISLQRALVIAIMLAMTSKSQHPDSRIIDALGGTMAVTRLCEVRSASVSKWRWTGIPRARLMFLKAIRPDVFVPELAEKERAGVIGRFESKESA